MYIITATFNDPALTPDELDAREGNIHVVRVANSRSRPEQAEKLVKDLLQFGTVLREGNSSRFYPPSQLLGVIVVPCLPAHADLPGLEPANE